MTVREIAGDECRAVLTRVSIGRLGCCLDSRPYVVPVCFAFEDDSLYVFSTFGQKIEWMRRNPKVCLQADEIDTRSEWVSVIVTGEYDELPDPPRSADRAHARELLEKAHGWWLTPLAERRAKADDLSVAPLFFRIRIDSMTGLKATTGG